MRVNSLFKGIKRQKVAHREMNLPPTDPETWKDRIKQKQKLHFANFILLKTLLNLSKIKQNTALGRLAFHHCLLQAL